MVGMQFLKVTLLLDSERSSATTYLVPFHRNCEGFIIAQQRPYFSHRCRFIIVFLFMFTPP
jgi:hypothetical protein